MLWDRGFFSYLSWKKARSQQVQLLCRVKKNMILKPFEHLTDCSCLSKISPSSYARQKDRDGIIVRVIRYKLDDPQRVGHEEEHILMTTLLDVAAHPAEELIVLDHEHWEEELTFDEQKTHVESFVGERLIRTHVASQSLRICVAKLPPVWCKKCTLCPSHTSSFGR